MLMPLCDLDDVTRSSIFLGTRPLRGGEQEQRITQLPVRAQTRTLRLTMVKRRFVVCMAAASVPDERKNFWLCVGGP